jgi:hypothetical protein
LGQVDAFDELITAQFNAKSENTPHYCTTYLASVNRHHLSERSPAATLARCKRHKPARPSAASASSANSSSTQADAVDGASASAVDDVSAAAGAGGFGDWFEDEEPCADAVDSRGLTRDTRRKLLLINPLVDSAGKRKQKTKQDISKKPPLIVLYIDCRVRLTEGLGFYAGLIPGATGTVVGFTYNSDAGEGPVLPGADLSAAVRASQQPQLPLVLVQFDAKYYHGETCHPSRPRVVPVYCTTCTIEYNGEKYTRAQLPLSPANASTVHQAQGSNAEQHVMCPPGAPHADFARALFYVAISRCETLAGLFLIMFNVTAKMFTSHRGAIAVIEDE